jgi:hypothetical protein
MSAALTGYYSIVQYCPDPMRKEVANIGVVLLCAETSLLMVRMAKSFHRITEVFPHLEQDKKQFAIEVKFVERRLRIDHEQFKTADALRKFAAERAGAMRLTLPLPTRVQDPATDLDRLFDRLVGERKQHTPTRIQNRLLEIFKENNVADRIETPGRVLLPPLELYISPPFGFRSESYHLIQTATFAGLKTSRILQRAGQYALEGELLRRDPHPRLGDMQLDVVARFGPHQSNLFHSVREILKEKKTRLFRIDHLESLLKEISDRAKPTNPSLYDEI